jgi:uncharacterized protein (TIGR02099 family)
VAATQGTGSSRTKEPVIIALSPSMSSTTSIVSPSDSTSTPPAASKGLRWFSGLASLLWWGSVVLFGLFALVWIAIYGLIVPRIGEFRPHLENRLSTALGVPLRIGEISAHVDGLMPTFTMSQVRLLDAQGRDALVLKTVTAAVSPHSLFDLGFEQLLIEQPELAIRRNAQGRITVAGLEVSDANKPETDTTVAADWLFSQGEIVIRSGTLRWSDELRGAPPLALNQVDFYLRNQGRRHQARLDATPPPEWGLRLSITGDFLGPRFQKSSGDWRSWQGQLHANLPQVDVQQLRQYAQIGIDITQGRGSLRGWLSLDQGAVRESTVDAALADVNVRLRPDLEPLAMNSLSGRFVVQLDTNNLALATQDLAFELRDGLRWPGGNVRLSVKERSQVEQMSGDFSADKLDLAALAQISDRLPLDAAVHAWLRELQPQGVLPELKAQWRGSIAEPKQYEVQGKAQGISLQASSPGVNSKTSTLAWHPGMRNAQLDFKFNEKSGNAHLHIERGSVSLPGVFEEPTVALDQFSSEINWQISGEQIQVQLPQIKFANADAQGDAKASWKTADPAKSSAKSRFPGILDLQGSLARAEGTKVHRYLPMFIAQEARTYVRNAVLEGKASQGSFKIKGDLHDMPFTDPSKGEFRIAAQVTGAVLDYVPRSVLPKGSLPWPALTQINGELVFERQSMAVRGASARVANAPSLALSKVEATIADLTQKQQVAISADARGNAADVMALVNTSPLLEISSKALAKASINGGTDLKLRLLLPINELDKSRVQGTVTLPGNDLQFSPDSPALQQAKGQIFFNEKGFGLRDASARAFGGELRLEGGSRPVTNANDVSVSLRAQGNVSAEGLRQAKELGYVSRLAAQATGSAAYAASLNIRRGVPEIAVSSNMQGLALNLPQPLAKAADTLLPLRYDNSLVRESLQEGRKLQDQLSLELGGLVSVNYLRDISTDVPRVIRGRIGVGLTSGEAIAANDDPGVAANINFAQINLDAWEKLLSSATSRTPAPQANTGLSAETLPYLPSILSVRARELTVQGRTLHSVVVGGSREDLTWRANLDARELNGYVEYRQPSGNNLGRVYARLARLSLAASTASDIEATLDQQPSSIPALDVVVEDFELRGTRMGRVELEALNRESSGVREWRLSKLNVSLPEAQFNATGNWVQVGASQASARSERRRTALNFKLDIANSGELLKRFGQDKVIARGKGIMQGQIAWLGAPWALDYPSMNGGFNLNVETGQFLKADPGIAKLLGVLSLQSLPRRLSLDFRDVFTEGFPFDFIRGDVKIEQGVAFTNNLQMKGVNAAVLMEGTANIAKETQDIKVVVVPEINAGTASLVAAAINPAIGIGTFLAQLILRRPVIEAATQEFQITGNWTEPQIVRVKRVSAAQAAPSVPVTSSTGVIKP